MSNIPIIMYHCINDQLDKSPLGRLGFNSKQFRSHLKFFKNNGFECITLEDLYERSLAKSIEGQKLAVLTFDDGFLDNSMVAAEIMKHYGAKGTVFVNPDQTISTKPDRDPSNQWGILSYPELRELEVDGIISVQSHTMTHDFEFSSAKVIDFYTPSKLEKYYWLVLLLFPDEKDNWMDKFEIFRSEIPVGYPIFEFGRSLTTKRFTPSDNFVSKCISDYSKKGNAGLEEANNSGMQKGVLESEQDYKDRTAAIVRDSKSILEKELQKEIHTVCFPGGAYNNHVLECAKECGYKLYMLSSRDHSVNNNISVLRGIKSDDFVGLRRISFTADYPKCLVNSATEYLNCKFHIDLFMGKSYAVPAMNLARTVKRIISR